MKKFFVGLVIFFAVQAQAVHLEVRWTEPDPTVTQLSLLQNGESIADNLLDFDGVAVVPAPDDGGARYRYQLQACNEWNQCTLSNTVFLQVPWVPEAPSLSIGVTK